MPGLYPQTKEKQMIQKKSIIIVSLILLAIALSTTLVHVALAATALPSRTFVLPSSADVTHSANTYIILFDLQTGNLVNASTGAVSASTAWGDADIATAVHAENGLVYTATIPALNSGIQYGIAVFDAASPAKTDVPTAGPLYYDPATGRTFTDTNPTAQTAVKNAPTL